MAKMLIYIGSNIYCVAMKEGNRSEHDNNKNNNKDDEKLDKQYELMQLVEL